MNVRVATARRCDQARSDPDPRGAFRRLAATRSRLSRHEFLYQVVDAACEVLEVEVEVELDVLRLAEELDVGYQSHLSALCEIEAGGEHRVPDVDQPAEPVLGDVV